jgi:hypothetical protein
VKGVRATTTVLLQPRETEYTTTEEQKTLKAGPKDFFLEQAAELRRSATFYRERAQQFEWLMKNPQKLPPLVKQDEEVPRPKQGNPKWLDKWYAFYWRAMDKTTSRERQAESLERQAERIVDADRYEQRRKGEQ